MRNDFDAHQAHKEYEDMPTSYKTIIDEAFESLVKRLVRGNIHLDYGDPSEFLIAAIHQTIKDSSK